MDSYLARDPDPRKWFPNPNNIDENGVVIGQCIKCGQSIAVCRGQHPFDPIPTGAIKPVPDPDMDINEKGGKQAKLDTTFIVTPKALVKVAEVFKKGEQKYGPDNWKLISKESQLDHALNHIYQYLNGDTTEPHLSHAATRLLMALEITLNDPPSPGV